MVAMAMKKKGGYMGAAKRISQPVTPTQDKFGTALNNMVRAGLNVNNKGMKKRRK